MLIPFFQHLRAAKLPVSIKEFLTLLEALKAEVSEVNAMSLATVDAHGQPSARIVPPDRFRPTVAAVSRELR